MKDSADRYGVLLQLSLTGKKLRGIDPAIQADWCIWCRSTVFQNTLVTSQYTDIFILQRTIVVMKITQVCPTFCLSQSGRV